MSNQVGNPHIELMPGFAGGQPHVAGRRIKVRDIMFQYEFVGRDIDEIAAEFDLNLSQVHAALAYYFDLRSEIDAEIADRDAFVSEMIQKTPSLLSSKLARTADG